MLDLRRLLATPEIGFLLAGIFIIFMAVGRTLEGRLWIRFQGWLYRSEEPEQFWWRIVFGYLFGAGLIGYYLFKVYERSH
jgi:hypothetical protein